MAVGKKRKRKPWVLKRYGKQSYVDTSKAPDWWLSAPDEVEAFLCGLRGVDVFEMGQSAGGRPIIAASWGPREDRPKRTSMSLASAISGGAAKAFYGEGERKRQGLLFLGDAHGVEFEGTVAALNFLNVVVTGKDLRGRRWPRMAREGRKLRIVIIPFFNIDGRVRYVKHRHFIGVDPEILRRITMGNRRNGEKLSWPECKLAFPLDADEFDLLGGYFNDNGANLVYDAGFSVECQPETKALKKLLAEEMPDCVLCSHTNNGSLVSPPDSFIPRRFRQRQILIGGVVGARCHREGMKKASVPTDTEPYAGEVFYQTDMIYHCCGALPLMMEFPCGYQNKPDNHDEILDIGMYAIEEVVAFGTAYDFRPHEPR